MRAPSDWLYSAGDEIHDVLNLRTGRWVKLVPPYKLKTAATDEGRRAEVEAYVEWCQQTMEFMDRNGMDPTWISTDECGWVRDAA